MRCDATPLDSNISNISDNLNGALYRNTVHRHEPPITKSPVLVLHKDEARQFIVISKPGSVVSHLSPSYVFHFRITRFEGHCDMTMIWSAKLTFALSLLILFVAGACDRKVLQAYSIRTLEVRSWDHRL